MSGALIDFVPVATITLQMLRDYAEVSGDYNPIHQDEVAAKAVGLPGIIAHGMLIAGFISERGVKFMRVHFPDGAYERLWRPAAVQTRFRAMTFPEDTVSVGGHIKSQTDSLIVLELQAKNQKGNVLATSSLSFSRS